jgi:hypothetical protein
MHDSRNLLLAANLRILDTSAISTMTYPMDAVDRPAKKPRLSAPPTPIGSSDKGAAKVTPAADGVTTAPAADSRSLAQRKQTDARARGRVEYQLGQLSDDNLVAIAKGLGTSGLYEWGRSLKAFGDTSKRHQKIAVEFAGLGSERYAHVNSLCTAASEFVETRHSDVFAHLPVLRSASTLMGVLAPAQRERLVALLSDQVLEPEGLSPKIWNALEPAERRKLIKDACYLISMGPARDAEGEYGVLEMMINFGRKDHSLDQEILGHLGVAADFFEDPNHKTLLKLSIARCKFAQDPKMKEAEITQYLDRVMTMQYSQKSDGLTPFFSVMPRLSEPVRSRLVDAFIGFPFDDEFGNDGEATFKEDMCAHHGAVLMRYASADQRRQLLASIEDGQVDRDGMRMLFGLAQGLPYCSNLECAAFVDVVLCIEDPEQEPFAIEHVAGLFDRAHPQLDRLVERAMQLIYPLDRCRSSAGILGGPAAALLSETQRAQLATTVVDALTQITDLGHAAVVMRRLTHQILDECSDAQREKLVALVRKLPLPHARCDAIGSLAPVFRHFKADERDEFIQTVLTLPNTQANSGVKVNALNKLGHGLADLTLAQQTNLLDHAIEADTEDLAKLIAFNPLADVSHLGQAITGLARGAAHLKGDLFPRLLAEINKRSHPVLRINGLSAAAESFAHEINNSRGYAVVPEQALD